MIGKIFMFKSSWFHHDYCIGLSPTKFLKKSSYSSSIVRKTLDEEGRAGIIQLSYIKDTDIPNFEWPYALSSM